MTWLRVDDAMVDHPKVEALSDAAFRLHLRVMSYCARFSTDGEIPRVKALQMCGRQKYIDECLKMGVWECGPSSYVVHDFLLYNPSKADLDKKAIAGAKGAAIRYGKAGAIAGATQSAMAPARDPVPARPDPDPSPAPADALVRCVRAFDDLMGTLAGTPTVQRAISAWLETAPNVAPGPAALFEEACTEAALNDGKSLKYVMAILKRWERDGREDKRPKQQNGAKAPGQPGTPEHGCATNVGSGLVVKCMECDIADAKRREEAGR